MRPRRAEPGRPSTGHRVGHTGQIPTIVGARARVRRVGGRARGTHARPQVRRGRLSGKTTTGNEPVPPDPAGNPRTPR